MFKACGEASAACHSSFIFAVVASVVLPRRSRRLLLLENDLETLRRERLSLRQAQVMLRTKTDHTRICVQRPGPVAGWDGVAAVLAPTHRRADCTRPDASEREAYERLRCCRELHVVQGLQYSYELRVQGYPIDLGRSRLHAVPPGASSWSFVRS